MGATRREFVGAGAGAVAVAGLGTAFWREIFGAADPAASASARTARTARSARGGYGPRGAPNELGLRLPDGFSSRLIARGGELVPGTGYRLHIASDGMAAFPTDGGGWILVSNSETLEGGRPARGHRRRADHICRGRQRAGVRHPVVRTRLTGRVLRALADSAGFLSGPAELAPDRVYSVAASEMIAPQGRPVGTEVEALAWYLERDGG